MKVWSGRRSFPTLPLSTATVPYMTPWNAGKSGNIPSVPGFPGVMFAQVAPPSVVDRRLVSLPQHAISAQPFEALVKLSDEIPGMSKVPKLLRAANIPVVFAVDPSGPTLVSIRW